MCMHFCDFTLYIQKVDKLLQYGCMDYCAILDRALKLNVEKQLVIW